MVRKVLLKYTNRLLSLDDTPERIAFSFALGVFLAFSPLLGFHTFLGILLAFIFGLNRVAVLVGLFINNPWTLVPIYSLANYVGGLLIGIPAVTLPAFEWSALWHSGYWVKLASAWRGLVPLVVGSSILAVVAATTSYLLTLHIVKQGRLRRAAH
jgi:uncharacterized protein